MKRYSLIIRAGIKYKASVHIALFTDTLLLTEALRFAHVLPTICFFLQGQRMCFKCSEAIAMRFTFSSQFAAAVHWLSALLLILSDQ